MNKQLVIFSTVLILTSVGFSYLGVRAAQHVPVDGVQAVAAKKTVKNKANEKVKEKVQENAPVALQTKKNPDYILLATAYVDRGQTKSQIYAGIGSVAVDRRLISHGTLLYIENYGLALATDTGRLSF